MSQKKTKLIGKLSTKYKFNTCKCDKILDGSISGIIYEYSMYLLKIIDSHTNMHR